MAKRRNRRTRRKTFPTRNSTRVFHYTKPRLRSVSYNARFVEARRTYIPTYTTKTKSVQTAAILSSPKRTSQSTSPTLPRSNNEKLRKALICAKRKIRKEVIHAKRHAGKSGQKRPNRRQNPDVKCNR